jgi:hypothetical protein
MQILLGCGPVLPLNPIQMRFLLRFMLLDGPEYSRSQAVQIHKDLLVDAPEQFGYGQLINLGDDEVPSVLWPPYCVADLPFISMKRVDDPTQPNKQAYVEQVFLVHEAEWERYPMPGTLRQIMERGGQKSGDSLSPD